MISDLEKPTHVLKEKMSSKISYFKELTIESYVRSPECSKCSDSSDRKDSFRPQRVAGSGAGIRRLGPE